MATAIKFGTDGWRALIAEDYTFDNVRICAQAMADELHANGMAARGVVVGWDTRFRSGDFAAACAEVFAANGITTYLTQQPTPTPVVSFAILDKGAGGAVMITSSHNAGIWNGFKIKPEYAGSASPDYVARVEAHIARIQSGGELKRGAPTGGAKIVHFDAAPAYFAQVGKLLDLDAIRQAGFTLVADAMHGAGIGYFDRLIGGGETRVIGVNQDINPNFPGMDRPEPIAENLPRLIEAVKRERAQVGLATDGDADRIGAVDEHGCFINQLVMYGLLALYLLDVRGWRGPLVKSLSTTSMADRLGELYDIPVVETPVGFKYIGPEMIRLDALMGGEESGGFGFRGHIPERDGVLAGLFLCDMMTRLGRTPSGLVDYLFQKVGPHYYDRLDLTFPQEGRAAIFERIRGANVEAIDGSPVARVRTDDGFKWVAQDGSWLLIRFSGTEPLMRIYTETNDPARVPRILAYGRSLAGI